MLLGFLIVSFHFLFPNPKTQGIVKLSGIIGKVVITRDKYGVPHIKAFKSDEDAFFAMGYVQAQDRLWQMEFERSVGEGRLSELFGSALLKEDEFLRTWGFYRSAQQTWIALSPRAKKFLISYSAGVNFFLKSGKLPLEFKILRITPRKWSPLDSLVWMKMLAFDLQDSWKRKLLNKKVASFVGKRQLSNILEPYPKNAPTILTADESRQFQYLQKRMLVKHSNQILKSSNFSLPHMLKIAELVQFQTGLISGPGTGSNNWVVSGKHTLTGKPILANDTHLSIQSPSIWYLIEISGPQIHVTGASLVGVPGVIIGHNSKIAWGVTDSDPDTQDLVILPKNYKSNFYTTKIKVKNSKPVNFKIELSRFGPVISKLNDGRKLALMWTLFLPGDTTFNAICSLQYAKDWSSFKKSLSQYVSPPQNFIYADTKGNIGYYLAGKIPVRKGFDPSFPVVASDKVKWSGFVPFRMMPHIYNPPAGYIFSANNKPITNAYPYYLNFRWNTPPYRVERIRQLLKKMHPMTLAKSEAMQLDVKSLLWESLKPYFLSVRPTNHENEEALLYLKQWNGEMSTTSIAASIFQVWVVQIEKELSKRIVSTDGWVQSSYLVDQLKLCPSSISPGDKNCNDLLNKTLALTTRYLSSKLGKNMNGWQWGKLHLAKFKMLGVGNSKWIGWIWNFTKSLPGSNETLNSGHYSQKNFADIKGSTYREVIDLSDFKNSEYITTPGESGVLHSGHFRDMFELWYQGRYIHLSCSQCNRKRSNTLILLPLAASAH